MEDLSPQWPYFAANIPRERTPSSALLEDNRVNPQQLHLAHSYMSTPLGEHYTRSVLAGSVFEYTGKRRLESSDPNETKWSRGDTIYVGREQVYDQSTPHRTSSNASNGLGGTNYISTVDQTPSNAHNHSPSSLQGNGERSQQGNMIPRSNQREVITSLLHDAGILSPANSIFIHDLVTYGSSSKFGGITLSTTHVIFPHLQESSWLIGFIFIARREIVCLQSTTLESKFKRRCDDRINFQRNISPRRFR